MNPNGSDGKPLLCKACGSYRHFIAQCPYSWENQQEPNVQIVEQEEENVVLFTTSQSHMGNKSEIGIMPEMLLYLTVHVPVQYVDRNG